jgi:hypothetical protein
MEENYCGPITLRESHPQRIPDGNYSKVIAALREDTVVLIPNLSIDNADRMMVAVAEQLQLKKGLEMQAAYADFLGHRSKQSNYFMSVNVRKDYQFITQHSEGDRINNIQLAAFFCFENTTDGGETLLMQVDPMSTAWKQIREQATRIARGTRRLTAAEGVRAKALYRLDSPSDIVRQSDIVLEEWESDIAKLKFATVLAVPETCHSAILNRDVFVYWDTIGCIDHDALQSFGELLEQNTLLRRPPSGLPLEAMDKDYARRSWKSGMTYSNLFVSKLIYKMIPGDLLIQNNLTWTHGVANWTPTTGSRRVVAAFA